MNLTLVKNIKNPSGSIKKITANSQGVIWEHSDIIIVPINSKNEIAIAKINVSAGDTVTIKYFITQNKGYIYDARECGLNYYGSVDGTDYPISNNDLNKECTIILNIPEDGFITVGAHAGLVSSGKESVGSLSRYDGDIPIGKYIKFIIN